MEGDRFTGAVIRGRDGDLRRVRAQLTVGADGLRSRVARALGGQHLGWPARVAFVAHVTGVPAMADRAEMHVSGGDMSVAIRAGHPWRWWCRNGAPRRVSNTSWAQPVPRRCGRVQAQPRPGVLVTGPFAARARRVTAPGVLLVGNAADFFDPFTGRYLRGTG